MIRLVPHIFPALIKRERNSNIHQVVKCPERAGSLSHGNISIHTSPVKQGLCHFPYTVWLTAALSQFIIGLFPAKLDSMCGRQNHQGVIAVTGAASYSEMEDIYKKAGDDPLFVIIADDITDPHNLGAIIRTAETAGAHGIIIPKRGGAGLTVTVAKTSAGAVEHLPVVRVSNLAATVEQLKKDGVWVYGTDMDGQCWCEIDYTGPVALIVGSEGKGMSRLLTEKCDFIASLPMYGEISSLNASVAAGIVMYEIARQRAGIKAR